MTGAVAAVHGKKLATAEVQTAIVLLPPELTPHSRQDAVVMVHHQIRVPRAMQLDAADSCIALATAKLSHLLDYILHCPAYKPSGEM